MNILVTIPHHYDPERGGRSASLRPDGGARAQALAATILSLHENFGSLQMTVDQRTMKLSHLASARGNNVRIIVVTAQGKKHVLGQLAGLSHLFLHVMPDDPGYAPQYLGVKCREILGHAFAKTGEGYDFYCYMEDDGVIHDPYFFEKLKFFNARFGNERVLLPARFEAESSGSLFGKRPSPPGMKLYPETELPADLTRDYPLGGGGAPEELTLEVMGRPVRFWRPVNPHAGCYFLNPVQMKAFIETPYFLEKSDAFIGPLESSATLGILKRFAVYKPHPANLAFLELQHHHAGLLPKVNPKKT